MSEVILSNANSPSTMRAKVTYTAGNGSISITKVEGYRTDGYSTTEYGASNGYVYVTIGGTSTSQKRTSIYFNANSSASTIWDAGATKSNLSGNTSISVTFGGYSNTNINNASFSTTINAGYANPSLTIKNSSHVLSVPNNTTDAGCTIPVSIGNTGGRTCTLKVNGAIYSSSISSDNSSYNIVLKKADSPAVAHNVQTIVENHTNASTFTIPIELYVGSLSSGVKYATIVLNDNIKPSCTLTLSGSVGIEDTNGNAMTALNGIHVAGLTKPTFTFTTTGIYSSTINTNKTLSITSGTASAAMTVTTSPATWGSAFNGVQTRTATLTCTDSRGRTGTSSGVSIALQNYDAPTVTPTITRCTSNGTTSATGHYAKMSFSITKSPLIKNSSDINTFTLKYSIDNKATWTNVTVSGSNGTYTASTGPFGGGNFAEENAYTFYYMYEDIYKKGQVVPIVLDPASTLISRHTGGDGVTLGRVATQSGFHDYLGANFHNGLSINGVSILDMFYPIGSVFISTQQDSSTANTAGKYGCPIAAIGGTWERVAGSKYLIGYDSSNNWFDKIGSSGSTGNTGSWQHTHTLAHTHGVPGKAHTHGYGGYYAAISYAGTSGVRYRTKGSISYTPNERKADGGAGYNYSSAQSEGIQIYGSSGETTPGSVTTNSQSTSTTSNPTVVSPFYTMYIWKRTA